MSITVFSLKTCPHCQRAKTAITNAGCNFIEVSLTDYPEKRTDMLKAANRLTVPQIFYHNKHIGGADALLEFIESGQAAKEIKHLEEITIQGKLDPINPLLEKPDYPPKVQPEATERTEESLCVGANCMSYTGIVTMLETELDLSEKRSGIVKYNKCFRGSNLVDLLVSEKYGILSREEGVQIGQTFLKSGLFEPVDDTDIGFRDTDTMYRLSNHCDPFTLNSYRRWVDRVDDPFVTLKSCKSRLGGIISKYRDDDGMVDYSAVSNDGEFADFEEMTCEFQGIKLGAMNPDSKLAFCINLYNLIVLHAFAKVGAPKNTMQRGAFFKNIGYEIGGLKFTLNELENGILRGNKTPPYHISRTFKASDPRTSLCLENPDPRIHFALNCGAKSCPPVKSYTPQAINEELRIVALAFMEQEENCKIDVDNNVIYLTKIFQWYKKDFGDNSKEIATCILPWVRDEKKAKLERVLQNGKPKIRHMPYDWGNDSKKGNDWKEATRRASSLSCVIS
mmetsp:Transcript_2320/g.4521  ORF Transcript_2320/g.4521 Transcript_2320/m.4521 type:complete len:507 (+) Transcript_2320:4177-5697(+)